MKSLEIYFELQVVLILLLITNQVFASPRLQNNVNHNESISGTKYLDMDKKLMLKWSIDSQKETIHFEVTAKTKGYVGFGLSPSGGMSGADIIIAGVNPEGTVYFSDRHGIGNTLPVEDTFANWNVVSGKETGTHTILKFHRLLNTCDDHDIPITEGTMRIIWALGETDAITYHAASNRGTKSINFYLNGDGHEIDRHKYEELDITATMTMHPEHTTYWCTIHRAPLFTKTQHIVAIEPILESAAALQHTHHFTIFRCLVTDDQDPEEIFEPWVSFAGDHCFAQSNASFPFSKHCNGNMLYVWSKGGNSFVLGPEFGLPMPDTPGRREYYAIEIHYDNPEKLRNVEFTTGARIYYTPNLREIEIGILSMGYTFQVELTVPPKSPNFLYPGHCSGACTEAFFPEDGITIFRNQFHSHLAGRKMRLRHFRGHQELPWIDEEPYYDFDFQQNKPLAHHRKVLRGDQLTVECTYDSMRAERGRAVIGGLRTQDEMCLTEIYYYPRQPMFFCGSSQNLVDHFHLFGITNYNKRNSSFPGGISEYEIREPAKLAGNYLDSVSYKVDWTPEFRERYQNAKAYGDQKGFCVGGGQYLARDGIKYPENLQVYVPPNECEGRSAQNGGLNVIQTNILLIIASIAMVILYNN